MVDQKMSLNKFKKTEIISSIFSDHNTMRLEINYKREKAGENDLVNELWGHDAKWNMPV